jgi:transposase InsO family protein
MADNGILPSTGSTGDSYDNALMENFWSTLKIELVYRTAWRTRDEAQLPYLRASDQTPRPGSVAARHPDGSGQRGPR